MATKATKIEEALEIIKGMTLLELRDLNKAIEEEFGITAAAPMMMAAGPAAGAPVEAEEEKTKSLRIGLLGILSGAVIQSNADSGYTRTKNNEEIRSFKLAEYQKLTSPVEKTRQYDALEMLSISAFL